MYNACLWDHCYLQLGSKYESTTSHQNTVFEVFALYRKRVIKVKWVQQEHGKSWSGRGLHKLFWITLQRQKDEGGSTRLGMQARAWKKRPEPSFLMRAFPVYIPAISFAASLCVEYAANTHDWTQRGSLLAPPSMHGTSVLHLHSKSLCQSLGITENAPAAQF